MPQANYIYPKHITFTFSHFADAFIQTMPNAGQF